MGAVGKVVVAKKVAGNRRDRKEDRKEGDEKTEDEEVKSDRIYPSSSFFHIGS